jgi:YEATS domain-containing protein 4
MSNQRVRGLSICRQIVYGNTATLLDPPIGDHTHRWTVAVRSAAGPPPNHYMKVRASVFDLQERMPVDMGSQRGGGDVQQIGGSDELPWIKKVTFRLHETYANPTRSECAHSPKMLNMRFSG